MQAAPINKIIPFSAVDGPGNRTAIFLQGCDQNCIYCHNPETIHHCSACGVCVQVCPAGALAMMEKNGKRYVSYDFAKCCNCDTCIKTCKQDASPKIRHLTAKEVFDEISPYFLFISGITTSGGECTLHLDFLTELYTLAKKAGKTTFADTNGQVPLWKEETFLQVTDKAMIDLKAGTEEDYRKLTGKGLANPVENIRQMAKLGKLYEIRTVVVPEMVNNHQTVALGSSLIAAYPEVRYRLIQFRHYGVRKEFQGIREPYEEEMEELRGLAMENGVKDVVIT